MLMIAVMRGSKQILATLKILRIVVGPDPKQNHFGSATIMIAVLRSRPNFGGPGSSPKILALRLLHKFQL